MSLIWSLNPLNLPKDGSEAPALAFYDDEAPNIEGTISEVPGTQDGIHDIIYSDGMEIALPSEWGCTWQNGGDSFIWTDHSIMGFFAVFKKEDDSTFDVMHLGFPLQYYFKDSGYSNVLYHAQYILQTKDSSNCGMCYCIHADKDDITYEFLLEIVDLGDHIVELAMTGNADNWSDSRNEIEQIANSLAFSAEDAG